MNDISKMGNKRMTVREVAEALGAGLQTVHDSIDRLFPGLKRNGITTYLDEAQVSAISADLKRAHNVDLTDTRKVAVTRLEMAKKAQEVMAWLTESVEQLRAELQAAAPKVESFDALQRSEHSMSITEAAKHFGLHPRAQVLPYLRAHGYLTGADLPSQSALDAGYLALRQTRCPNDVYRPQAVVLACQLETWRTRVVPQIAQWEAKE